MLTSYTITFYMKFIGINFDSVSQDTYPIIYLYDDLNFIGWNNTASAFCLVHNKFTSLFTEKNSTNYIGKWIHYGLSVYKSQFNATLNKYIFPNMINFMIDKKVLIPNNNINVGNYLLNANTLGLNNKDIIAFYSDLRIYNTFYFGTYGLIQNLLDDNDKNLFLYYRFYSSDNLTCIDNNMLNGTTKTDIGSSCQGDFHEYNDFSTSCNSNNTYLSINMLRNRRNCTSKNKYFIIK
jgi:hypothetical protein